MIADLDHVDDFWIFIEKGDEFSYDEQKPLVGKVMMRENEEFRTVNLYVVGNTEDKIKIIRKLDSNQKTQCFKLYLPQQVILEVVEEGSFGRRNHSPPNGTNFGIFLCFVSKANLEHQRRYKELKNIIR
ncbi:MAG: hypothetical protein ACLFPL_03285 [Candidatus Nanoarchaeia archaeon]